MMFHRIFGLSLYVLVVGMAHAHPDKLEQRRDVIPCALQEKLFSALTSKAFENWGSKEFEVLKELKAYRDAVDSTKLTRDAVLVKTSSSERSQDVSQASQDDVVCSPLPHSESFERSVIEKKVLFTAPGSLLNDTPVKASSSERSQDVSQASQDDVACSPITGAQPFERSVIEKKSILKFDDHILNRLPVRDLDDDSEVSAYMASKNPVLAQPAPIIIVVKQAPSPVVAQRVFPPSFFSPTIKRVTTSSFAPRSNPLVRAMPRYTRQTQNVSEDTVFVNILANRKDAAKRGAGTFSCLSTPTYANSIDSKFAAKLPLFNATTLSHATSNVPFDSL